MSECIEISCASRRIENWVVKLGNLTPKQRRGFDKALEAFAFPESFIEQVIGQVKAAGIEDKPFSNWKASDKKIIRKVMAENGIDPEDFKKSVPKALLLHGSIRELRHSCVSDFENYWRNVLGKVAPIVGSSKLEGYISVVCAATGWNREAARAEMERVRKATGMPFFRYAKNQCWTMDDCQIALLQEKRERQKAEREQLVMDATGWDLSTVRQKIKAANALGLTSKQYIDYQCWSQSDEELIRFANAIELGNEVKQKGLTREERIRSVAKQAGCSFDRAKATMDAAKEMYGISYYYYEKYHGWELTSEELAMVPTVVQRMKESRERNNQYYYNLALRKSGLSQEELTKDIAEKQQMGISVMRYVQRSMWKIDDDLVKRSALTFSSRNKKAKKTLMEDFVPTIQKETGWSVGRILLEIEQSRSEFGASGLDYFQYRFWELTPDEQGTFLTWGLMQKARLATTDFVKGREYFDDKAGFARRFGDVMKHDSFKFDRKESFDSFCERIVGWDYLMVKPINASGGTGVCKKHCNASTEENRILFDTLREGPDVVIDQCIIQHHLMSDLNDSSVNTVRMVTLNHKGECIFLLACLRMGTGAAVDNLHSGGLAAEVELESGRVCSDAIDYYGSSHAVHPVSGAKINGFQIPHWDILLDTCRKIYNRVEGVELIGWDFAITESGVDVIEGNTGSGYDAMQMPHRLHHRTGLRAQAFDPYFSLDD